MSDWSPDDDYSRRTLLANERTYLAWWRTGLTTLTVALAAARVIPELAGSGPRWPYTVLGIGFAGLGILCMAYGEYRREAVVRALKRGEFADVSTAVALTMSIGGVVLGAATLILIIVGS
jgi:putative membrane protein